MKSFYMFLFLMIGFLSTMESQTIVSTQPSNRNVLIEEFTGMLCPYCPEGHKILNDLVTNYQDRVFPVNIHTNVYAMPNQQHSTNLITECGDSIAAESGVEGFPSASINRAGDPKTVFRTLWQGRIENIISQQSPVNLAVQANVNMTTRELSVLVEYYYTDDEVQPTNRLSVFLTQSEIVAFQMEGKQKNPEFALYDDLYRHQHVLRMPVTESIWGEPITQTSVGTFGQREYTIILPDSIKNVPLELGNLNVVAFISPDHDNIITAAGAEVEIPSLNRLELAIEDKTELPAGYFFDTFNPRVKVTNEYDTEVTQFDVYYEANGNIVSQTYSGLLQKGDSVIVEIGDVLAEFTGNFKVGASGLYNINNSDSTGVDLIDKNRNKHYSEKEGIRFAREAFDTITFSFANKEHLARTNLDVNSAWNIITEYQGIGANNTNNAVFYHLSRAAKTQGLSADLMFGEANISILEEPKLKYYYAYSDGQVGGTAPEIVVSASGDDGASWQELHRINAVQTGTVAPGGYYYPTSDDYIQDSVDLSAFLGSNAIIKLSVIPGSDGNLLWIDEVSLEGTIEDGGIINSNLSELDFDEIQVGNSVKKEVNITNTGKTLLEISSLTILNDNYDVFSVKQLGDKLTIPAGESLDIEVSFLPVDTEIYESELWISSSDKKTPKTKIDLRGEGSGSSIADNLIEDASIRLMPNPVKESGSLEFIYSGTQTIESNFSVVDLNGKEVANLGIHTIYNGRNTFSLEFSDLVSGLYFIRLEAGAVLLEQIPVIIER